jgi:hypothetical protein
MKINTSLTSKSKSTHKLSTDRENTPKNLQVGTGSLRKRRRWDVMNDYQEGLVELFLP